MISADTYDMLQGSVQPKKVVLANGVFDILHRGHVEHLRAARMMGDMLIVALTDDDYVRKGPGRPLNDWHSRYEVLKELRCVDKVIHSIGAVHAIRYTKPAIFCKGIDYSAGDKWTEDVISVCREVGTEIRYTMTPKMSATDLIRRTMGIA